MNTLYFGDNLTVLREHVPDASVDLVYLDPPFNSNASYGVLFKDAGGRASESQAEAFRDSWSWGSSAEEAVADIMAQGGELAILISGLRKWLGECGLMAYIAMMAVRLIELKRVLKPTGSLYLHCDPTASHYLKLVLDAVFGHRHFQNEIIWKRTGSHGGSKRWGPVHDVILFYTATGDYTWNRVFQDYDQKYLDKFYRFADERGRYHLVTLTGAGVRTGDSGRPWRGVDPSKSSRHWAVPKASLEAAYPDRDFSGLTTQEKLDLLDEAGLIYWPSRGAVPRQKRYSDESPGVGIQDIITDIGPISSQSRERLGYPTQKPISLLERIIKASSNEGGVILDPFCGCGTTVEAAERLNRKWIGIDVTHYAVTLIERRMADNHPSTKYRVHGRPADLAGAIDLAHRDKHQFQWWACWLLGAQSYRESKKGADRGIDGRIFFHNGPFGHGEIIISVNGGETVQVSAVRDLRGVIEREDAAMGLLVTLAEPTGPMIAEAAAAGFVQKSAHGRLQRIQIATVAELLAGKMPKLPPLPQRPALVRTATKPRKPSDQIEMLLPFAGDTMRPRKGDFIDPAWLPLDKGKSA